MNGTAEVPKMDKKAMADLPSTFERRKPYSVREKLEFLVSLKRGRPESYSAFLNRVQWVIESVVQSADVHTWTIVLFLLGLGLVDRAKVIKELELRADLKLIAKSMDGCKCELLDYSPPNHLDSCDKKTFSNVGRNEVKLGQEFWGDFNTGDDDQIRVHHITFACKERLEDHRIIHTGDKQHQCQVCCTSYNPKAALGHQEATKDSPKEVLKPPNRPHQCTFCFQRFVNKSDLNRHMEKSIMCSHAANQDLSASEDDKNSNGDECVKGSNRPYNCQICLLAFATKGNLSRHMKTTHAEDKPTNKSMKTEEESQVDSAATETAQTSQDAPTRWQCRQFEQTFATRGNLSQHKRSVHAEDLQASDNDEGEDAEGPRCKICQTNFSSDADLAAHMLIHDSEKPHQCQHCQKRFRTNAALTYHMVQHTGDSPHRCEVCRKAFQTRGLLQRHTRSVNCQQVVESHRCKLCSANFKTKKLLKQHLNTHTEPEASEALKAALPSHPCHICNKVFHIKYKLDAHVLLHTGEKPEECPVCQRTFRQKRQLRIHMWQHNPNKERPHKCKLCPQTHPGFITRQMLAKHMSMHTDERPHQCPICALKFKRKDLVKCHIRRQHPSELQDAE